jgi:hypothetical protein
LIGAFLIAGFVIRLGADYYKYLHSFTSAPFYVSVIARSLEFLLPALICFGVSGYIKK